MLRTVPTTQAHAWPAARFQLCAPLWHVYYNQKHSITHNTRCMAACTDREEVMSAQQEEHRASVMHLLADAHCHPQLDPANMHEVLRLQTRHLAAMSVSYDVDWDIMLQLHKLAGQKVIPGFGIHPWWSHLHASSQGNTWQQLLEAPTQEQQQQAIDILNQHDPVTNSGAYATNRPEKPEYEWSVRHLHQQQQQGNGSQDQATVISSSNSSSSSSSPVAFTGIHSQAEAQRQRQQQQQGSQQQQQESQQQSYLGEGLRVVPLQEWEGRLRELLTHMPTAFVGEIGIDRSAVIPGSKARTSFKHQLELVQRQVALAAEFQRPVSVHCVRGYGHLLDFFTALSKHPAKCPPKIMLHSYGGSVEEIPRYYKLPNIGDRFYYSFSHAINHRTPDKLKARIAAVPDNRLLIESDQVTPLVIDNGMLQICKIVSEVKGWSLDETAQRMLDNFMDFYVGQLTAMEKQLLE